MSVRPLPMSCPQGRRDCPWTLGGFWKMVSTGLDWKFVVRMMRRSLSWSNTWIAWPGHPLYPIQTPLNYLARWPWVDAALINSIALGEFDIYSLPKLHPDEDYRNRQIAKVAEGIRVPLNGGQPEVMIGRTKMHIAFKEPYTFFSAWQIYISIRSTYDSTRAPGLAFWTEKLFFWLGLTYPWPYILNYIIMYHQKYRKSQPDQWFDYDVQMFSNCVTIPTQKPSTSTLAVSTFTQSQSKPAKRSLALPISEQICRNYNYFTCPRDPCPRRHVCALCERKDHLAPQCPSSKHSPGAK